MILFYINIMLFYQFCKSNMKKNAKKSIPLPAVPGGSEKYCLDIIFYFRKLRLNRQRRNSNLK